MCVSHGISSNKHIPFWMICVPIIEIPHGIPAFNNDALYPLEIKHGWPIYRCQLFPLKVPFVYALGVSSAMFDNNYSTTIPWISHWLHPHYWEFEDSHEILLKTEFFKIKQYVFVNVFVLMKIMIWKNAWKQLMICFMFFFMFLFTYFMIILWMFLWCFKGCLKKQCVDFLFSLMFVLTFLES